MIYSRYTETCEVILDYPKMGGEGIKDISKKSIRDILQANIDVHSRILIAEFPEDGIKCIGKLQWNCANMAFDENVDMTGPFEKSHIKEENMQ